jgi:hypothetical protein
MAKGFGSRKAAIAGSAYHIYQLITRFVKGHLTSQNGRDIQIDVFAHGLAGEWVSRELDHRPNGIPDDIDDIKTVSLNSAPARNLFL